MKEYHGSSLKAYKATYTGAAIHLNNKCAATKNVKDNFDKVADMLKTMSAVSYFFVQCIERLNCVVRFILILS